MDRRPAVRITFEGSYAMNKTDLIAAIAEKAELSKADAGKALEGLIEAVKDTLKKGEDVALVGFGTFKLRSRAARTGRNPRTNEEIKIPASKVPAFTAGKALKDHVN
jgi:nucleoid DNA-binding protein